MNPIHCRICYLLSITIVIVIARVVSAEVSTIPSCELKLSLPEFRAYALKASPLTAEVDRDYANQLAQAFELETLQNPELQYDQTFTRMELGGAKDPQAQISLGQPVRISHFGQREEVAKLLRKAGDLQQRAKLFELSQNLSIKFATLQAYDESLNIIDKASSRSANKIKLIHDGVKKGLISSGEEQIFEGERHRLDAQAKGIRADMSILQNEISRAHGLACRVRPSSLLSNEPLPPLHALIEISNRSLIGEAKRIEILADLADEQRRLAELDSVPQLTPRLVYQHTNDGGDFIGLGLTIPLPLWNQNQGERRRSEAESKLAALKTQFVDGGGIIHILDNLRTAAAYKQEQASIYRLKVIPAFEAALNNQEKQYSEGKGGILQVWQALRTFNEAQQQGLQLWLESVNVRVQLSILVGEEI